MKKLPLVFALCLGALPLCMGSAYAKDRVISVVGVGEVKAMPDTAVLSFSINSIKKDAKEARDEVEKTVTAFVGALTKTQVDKKDIEADSLYVSPRYSYDNGKSILEGYQASRNVKVTLSDMNKIVDVTDMALSSGINEVSGFSYQLKDRRSYQEKANELAMEDALDKANSLAKGFDVKLGEVLSLSYGRNSNVVPLRASKMLMASADAANGSSATYTTQEITITSEVNASFDIEDKDDKKDKDKD